MKLYKKTLAVMMMITTIFSVSAFANTNAERTTLTVAEATRRAIANNQNINAMNDTEELSIDSLAEIKLSYLDAQTTIERLNLTIKLRQAELSYALNLDNIVAAKDNVEFSIISLFQAIINAEKSLDLTEQSLKFQAQNLDILKLRVSLGLESKINYDTAKNSYERAVLDRDNIQKTIEDAYVSLNRIMGNNNLNLRYNLELNLLYKELETVNLTTLTARYRAESINIKEAENRVYIARRSLDSHESVSTYAHRTNDIEKQRKEADLRQASENLRSTRRTIEESVLNQYNAIKGMENSRAAALLELEQAKRELEILEIRFELGQITRLTLDQKIHGISTIEDRIRRIEGEHTIAIMKFLNPNIVQTP